MKAPRSKAITEIFGDKKATEEFYGYVRRGASGKVTVGGEIYFVEPVRDCVKRLIERKKNDKT